VDHQQHGARLPTTGPPTARADGRLDMTEHHGRHGHRIGPLRAADTDRQAAVDRLGTALREGRLDLAEYDERLQQAYAARTYHELDELLTDLPTSAVAENRGSWRVRWVCCLPVPYRETRAPDRRST
jgi:hypothetical protein